MQNEPDKSVDPHNFVLLLVVLVLVLVLLVLLVLIVLVLIVNRFKPFPVKSNDSNSIISLKSQFWVIFSHIGDLLSTFCPFWAKFPSTLLQLVPSQIGIIGKILILDQLSFAQLA